jgi:hypothetical protein
MLFSQSQTLNDARSWQKYVPVLLATLIVGGLCLFAEPLYDANDDSFLAMVGGGFGVAVHPEPHLIWSHIGYGLLLGILRQLVGVNAHGWVTLGALWLSLVLLLQTSLRARSWIIRWFLVLVAVAGIYLDALLTAQFTITAGVLFGAAVASWLVWANQERPPHYTRVALIILSLILSYLIRPDSYWMGFLIILPALLFLSLLRETLGKRARALALTLAVIAVTGFATDKIAYLGSPEWRQVPGYFNLNAQFNDFRRVPWLPNAPEYKQVGWSLDDYAMFVSWYSRDPTYSADKVSLLVKKLGIPRTKTALAQIRDWFFVPFTSWTFGLILVTEGLMCTLLDASRRRLGIFLVVGEFAAIAIAASTGRLAAEGSHVWFTASAITLAALCALLSLTPPTKGSLLRRLCLVLAAFSIAAVGCMVSYAHSLDCRSAAAYRQWINQNKELLNGKVTVWCTGLRWEWLITPTRIYPPFPALRVASIDDINSTPVETAMLKQLGIDDLAKELCTDPEMRLFTNKPLIRWLIGFCREHFGISPVFKEVAGWEDTGVYELGSSTDQPSSGEPASH